ncbi:hypothetical protein [Aeromonas salmonicida]
MLNQNLSDVELAKRLKELKGITSSDKDFNEILKKMLPKEKIDEVNRIIRGLSQEDEFALICSMMECCSSITPLDQTPLIIDSDEKTPDFQITFHPASFFSDMPPHKNFFYKCMVEVKSTDKLRFKTSRTDINKRKAYAERFGLPLLYAVRFLKAEGIPFWVIVTAERLLDKNTLTSEDYIPSLNSLIFDNYSLMINCQYTCIRRYSKRDSGIGEVRDDLGSLQGITISDEKGTKYTLNDNDALLFSMLFGVFSTYGTYIETFRGESTVYSHFSINQFNTLLDVVYRMTNIITNKEGTSTFEPTRAIANMDSPNNPTLLIRRSILENMIKRVNKNCPNFFLFGMLGDKGQHEEKINALFPTNKS